jgi:virulence-associated protein VagC
VTLKRSVHGSDACPNEIFERYAKLHSLGLPHDLRFGGKEVLVRRYGNGVLLEPLPELAGVGDSSLASEAVTDSNPKKAAFLEAVERAIREMEES